MRPDSNVVREITPSGVIRRFAGTGVPGSLLSGPSAARAQLDYPVGVAVNAQGDVFISDSYNNRVLVVSPFGTIVGDIGTGKAGYAGDGRVGTFAELNQPAGLALDAKGNLYIADAASDVIRRVDARTGIITTVAGSYAADQASDGLGAFAGDGGPATSARLNGPQGVALDGAGDLFVVDTFNNAIREVTPDGAISTVVNSGAPTGDAETTGAAPTASHLSTPFALAIDQATDVLYIADTHNTVISEVFGLAHPGDAAGPTAPDGQ